MKLKIVILSNVSIVSALLMFCNQAIADRLECNLTSPAGKPSLLGRAAISAREYVYPTTGEVSTEFRYTQFPAELNQHGRNVFIETERILTISGDMHHAQKLLSENQKYYDQLFGDHAPIDTSLFAKHLVCKKPSQADAQNELEKYYKAVLSKLENTKAQQLHEIYEMWIKSRDMTCSLESTFTKTLNNDDDFVESCLIRVTENYSKTLSSMYAKVNPATTD